LSYEELFLQDLVSQCLFSIVGSRNQDVVEEATLPTLRTLWMAPASSPLAEVNANNVADFLVQLTNKQNRLEAHKNRVPPEEVLLALPLHRCLHNCLFQ
jgi:hypothetical protein